MKIEILGTGCAKCKELESRVNQALAKVGGFHQVLKVKDPLEIMNYGVMSTPGLVVDGEVKSSGKLLTIDEILEYLK